MVELILCVQAVIASSIAFGAGQRIDLTTPVRPAEPTELGQGTNTNPQGDTLTADNRSFFLNGTAWIPVAGEFHYTRYPAEEWRDELLKIKAGGITVLPTYVFWIHHEEKQGRFDWSGRRSLRDFVQLCAQLDLKVIVRMGPWCHGEVRNGGFPDWVQKSGVKLRTTDPAFMAMVQPLYREISKQIEGLLWKDGGPVIGVQHDNERNDVPYLLALKALAKSEGVDVPLYTMTGWNRVAIPPSELLPLFGAYSVAFWYPHSNLNFRKSFFFTDIRDDGDMGAQFVNTRPSRSENILRYPYVCCEIGGGMPSSYTKRIKVDPDEIASMALVRLGCGSNMPGYYMYHGGINPDGETWLNEASPNPMPVKDYDFQAPLGAFGQIREHFYLLRMQHLFIEDFGSRLARMPLYLPERRPSGLDDVDTVRWSVRSDGESGFVFFNNYQPVTELPDKEGVRFHLKTHDGQLTFPESPITIPTGVYGIFPFRMECDGLMLEYATVQPICRLQTGDRITYFFTALRGIAPELVFEAADSQLNVNAAKKQELSDRIRIFDLSPGTHPVVSFFGPANAQIQFVVLPFEQGRYLSRVRFAGLDRMILSEGTVLEDGTQLRLLSDHADKMELAIYPSPKTLNVEDEILSPTADGIFNRFSLRQFCTPADLKVDAVQIKHAGPKAIALNGTDEASWEDAAVWKLVIPEAFSSQRIVLNLMYFGDAARLYAGDELFNDNYFNGDPFALGLWRIPQDKRPDIRLKILPYSDRLLPRLPEAVKEKIAKAKTAGSLNNVTVQPVKLYDLRIDL